MPVSSRTVRRILARNGLHSHNSAHKPALNKRQRWFMGRDLRSIPSAANIVDDPQGASLDPRFTQKTVKFGGGKIMVTSNKKVPGRSVRWMVTLKYRQILASQYIPNYKRGQIFQQDGAPCHTSGSTMKFLRGKKIKVLHQQALRLSAKPDGNCSAGQRNSYKIFII